MKMNSENFYDQLARDDYLTSQIQFQQEMKQIQHVLDKDLGSNLQESSGLINPLGLRGESLYNQKGGIAQVLPPNFGRRDQGNTNQDDYGSVEPSARNPRDSADLTIDMLSGQGHLAARKQPSEEVPRMGASNMPRNQSSLHNYGMQAPAFDQVADGFSIEQFRQNNAQLHEIMMQLQTPHAVNLNMAPPTKINSQVGPLVSRTESRSVTRDDKFKQLSSAPTGHSDSIPSSKQTQIGEANIKQFSYKDEDLGRSSIPLIHKYSYPQESSLQNLAPNPSSYQQYQQQQKPQNYFNQDLSKGEMLNQAIAKQQPLRSTSPLGMAQMQQVYQLPNNVGNNRQGFKPNSAFQTVGHSIIDSKENFNYHNGDAKNLASSLIQQVSQVELLSQLQQSSIHQSSSQYQQQQQLQYNYSSKQVQPSLAGEFTLQPRQPGSQPSIETNNFGPKQQISQSQPPQIQVLEQHKKIMRYFDDIPISQIQKMPGYQTGHDLQPSPMTEEYSSKQGNVRAIVALEDEDAESQPLEERIQHFKWNIRLKAYKEMNNLFYNDYAQFEQSKNLPESTPNGNVDLMSSFDQYGPLLEKMIKDTNLVAAIEGLQVLHTYVKLSLDIKTVTFNSHNFLLEKIPTNKANFRDICVKILLVMLERDQGQMVYPELVKRMKSPQQKISSFAMFVISEALKTETALYDLNLRNVFRMIQDNLSQKNKELRDLAIDILQQVYVRCSDDLATFLVNCKGLRPVQTKEIREVLSKQEKITKGNPIKLFESYQPGEEGGETSANAKETKDNEAAARHGNPNTSNFEPPQRDSNNSSLQSANAEPIDLLNLIPDNFNEIPYISQINLKKKSMESFNGELSKLVGGRPGSVVIKNKDYTLIYNTVAHMLEDKNMLVFVEAIKTVELLSILIGPMNYLKQPKVKAWISLLAGKYGETKTAVIAAVDRAMLAVVKHAYNQVMFSRDCVNEIASTHKNPRVKQFIIEHTMVPFVQGISGEKDLLGNIFRAIKDKLVQMVLKDTSACCRDAAVTLLVTFKTIIPENAAVEEAITALPKYRISEIQKRVDGPSQESEDSSNQIISAQAPAVNKVPVPIVETQPGAGEEAQDSQEQKPKFAKSLTQKIKAAKGQSMGNTQQAQGNFTDEILQGRFITKETKAPMAEILYDLGKMKSNQFEELYDCQTMEQKWDSSLRQIGEVGIRECKPILINAIFTVVTTPKIQLFENQQCLKSMLNLAKRLLVLERSIERNDDGRSVELEKFLKLALLQNVWIANNQGETCQMLQVGLIATGNAFEFTDHLRDVVEQPVIIQCPAALQIIEAIYVWLGIRLNDFLAQGMELSDLEMLRGFGIKYLDGAGFNEPQRQALISIMIKFKDLVKFKREEVEHSQVPNRPNDIDQELPSESQISRQKTPQIDNEPIYDSDARLQSSQFNQPQTAKFAAESIMHESDGLQTSQIDTHRTTNEEQTAENICRLIDTEFEKGLLLFKDMAQQQTLDFEIKQKIFLKLISIVSEGYKSNPQQQYKQAYALKALMWMKEETLGIEDSFRLTQKVMGVFAKAEVNDLDSTVELYLLNFWSKDLSIRDLTDRIGLCVLNSDGSNSDQAYQTGYSVSMTAQKCSRSQLDVFNSLLRWFSDKRLFKTSDSSKEVQDEEDEWMVTDLRKIVLFITLSVLDKTLDCSSVSRDFLRKCVGKFSSEKVKEFMEIQLMHHNELSLKLLDWLDNEFESRIKPTSNGPASIGVEELDESYGSSLKVKPLKMPNVNLDEVISQRNVESSQYSVSESSAKQGQSSSSRHTPRGLTSASVSYKERRDLYKMKGTGKGREGSNPPQAEEQVKISKYSEIIGKKIGDNSTHKRIDEASGESDEKASYLENSDEESKKGARQEETDQPFRRTNTSAYYRSIENKRRRYTPSAEELADDQDIQGDSSSDETITEQPLKRETLQRLDIDNQAEVHQIEDQIQLSTMKEKHINDKIKMLELEKTRIEKQSEILRQQKDEESTEWKAKVDQMENEHAQVISSLANVNAQYSKQVSENEQLRIQLNLMSKQHTEMMSRFEQIEKKLDRDRNMALSPKAREPSSAVRESTAKKDMIVNVQKLQRIEETFGQTMLSDGTQIEIQQMIQKIQKLLLSVEKNVEGELAQPLIIHYSKLRLMDERMQMLSALEKALDQNEDVLSALSSAVYKALLNYLLWAFAHEKQILENTSINGGGTQADQNQVTMLSQQLVSKLLNSKRFTTSLVSLFQLLREAMPTNIAAELSIEERQYLRVIMRCIQRITRALHSEQPDMVRAFDVLLEMQKMFIKHPPELLREDLPCLADFDFIYRGMKDVSDRLIELQPEKVESFLNYATGGGESEPQNAFIKYLLQMMSSQAH